MFFVKIDSIVHYVRSFEKGKKGKGKKGGKGEKRGWEEMWGKVVVCHQLACLLLFHHHHTHTPLLVLCLPLSFLLSLSFSCLSLSLCVEWMWCVVCATCVPHPTNTLTVPCACCPSLSSSCFHLPFSPFLFLFFLLLWFCVGVVVCDTTIVLSGLFVVCGGVGATPSFFLSHQSLSFLSLSTLVLLLLLVVVWMSALLLPHTQPWLNTTPLTLWWLVCAHALACVCPHPPTNSHPHSFCPTPPTNSSSSSCCCWWCWWWQRGCCGQCDHLVHSLAVLVLSTPITHTQGV